MLGNILELLRLVREENIKGEYIDIVGDPEMIRAIGLAIVNKATELLARSNQKNFFKDSLDED